MAKFVLVFLLFPLISFAQQSDSTKEDTFVDVSKEPVMIDTLSKIIEYPKFALEAGIEGKVSLSVFINTKGTVEKVVPNAGSDSLFIDAAVTAVKKVRFSPALDTNNNPVAVWWNQPIYFKLPKR